MSSKITSPTQKSNGFIITLVAVIVLAAAVIGYIYFNGKHSSEESVKSSLESVEMNIDTTTDFITLSGKDPAADAKQVDLYEDYSCPHCAELAKATDGDMKEQIEAGKLVVNIHPLNFLDTDKVKLSSTAGAAALAVAEQGDAALYWNYRKTLFEKQRDIYPGWTPEDFAQAAKSMGADSATVKKVKDQSELEAFRKEAEANASKLESTTGRVSSPQIIFDGKAIEIANKEGTDFANWPKEVVDGAVRFHEEAAK